MSKAVRYANAHIINRIRYPVSTLPLALYELMTKPHNTWNSAAAVNPPIVPMLVTEPTTFLGNMSDGVVSKFADHA